MGSYLKIYVDPKSNIIPNRVDGLYIDLRGFNEITPSHIVDFMKNVGIDPKNRLKPIEIIAVIDPEKPPQGLELIGSLWRLIAAIDLGFVRSIATLEIVQRSFRNLAVKIDVDNLRYSISVIALLVPDYTIIPRCSLDIIRDLKIYAGASTGEILVEGCDERELEDLTYIISGLIIRSKKLL
ncbi:MAG: hypothetical protein QXE01_00815 [Sulfolobales archaeon]